MTEAKSKQFVLVVDDEFEWQDMIRAMLRKMGAEVLVADTLEKACEIAVQHPPDSSSPLALVIIDMRLPHRADDVELDEEAGIYVLRAIQALQTYRLVECPMIVFTAWPSYVNCVRALKAGAWTYISKVKDEDGTHGGSRGLEELRECCERLLVGEEPLEVVLPPGDEWLSTNYDWLSERYGGNWVALVQREGLDRLVEGSCEQDGIIVLPGDSFDAVRDVVIKLPELLRKTPVILFVPKAHTSP